MEGTYSRCVLSNCACRIRCVELAKGLHVLKCLIVHTMQYEKLVNVSKLYDARGIWWLLLPVLQ